MKVMLLWFACLLGGALGWPTQAEAKVCRKGCACGNTCIACWKQCHVGRGSAVNWDGSYGSDNSYYEARADRAQARRAQTAERRAEAKRRRRVSRHARTIRKALKVGNIAKARDAYHQLYIVDPEHEALRAFEDCQRDEGKVTELERLAWRSESCEGLEEMKAGIAWIDARPRQHCMRRRLKKARKVFEDCVKKAAS